MVQRSERLRFTREPHHALGIVGDRVAQDRDGEVASQPWIARPIDFAHTAGSEQNGDVRARRSIEPWGSAETM